MPLARLSGEDERPAGLKLDRGGYGFSREREPKSSSSFSESTHELLRSPSTPRPFQPNPKATAATNDNDDDDDDDGNDDDDFEFFAPSRSSRDIYATGKPFKTYSTSSNSGANPSSRSPSIPARSPFRPRDSQNSITQKPSFATVRGK